MKYLANIDLTGNQLLNVVVQVLATAPASPAAGRMYYDSALAKLRYYNGSGWVDLDATATDAATLNGQLPTYYLSRANHTGTQVAATIADFASAVAAAITAGDVALGSHKLTGVADPQNPQDAATKAYVRAATTGNVTLSGTQTIDGVDLIAGDRVLVKDQTAAATNGIYVVAAGAWNRSGDADTGAKVTGGMFTFVEEGTTNADSG